MKREKQRLNITSCFATRTAAGTTKTPEEANAAALYFLPYCSRLTGVKNHFTHFTRVELHARACSARSDAAGQTRGGLSTSLAPREKGKKKYNIMHKLRSDLSLLGKNRQQNGLMVWPSDTVWDWALQIGKGGVAPHGAPRAVLSHRRLQ